MSVQEDGTLGVCPVKERSNQSSVAVACRFIGAVIIYFAAVTSVATFVNGGLYG